MLNNIVVGLQKLLQTSGLYRIRKTVSSSIAHVGFAF